MQRSCCKIDQSDSVLTVTIDRPERLNALSYDDSAELAAVFDMFHAAAELRVAIITGAGERAFSAGNDLSAKHDPSKPGLPPKGFGGLTNRFDLDKPIIAAVNGVAVGGGFEMALACDLIVASDAAEFGLVEPRVGLAALAGGIQKLAHEIPLKQAMSLILTGRRVTAADGYRFGFVNQVVSQADLLDAARRLAEEILSCAPLSIIASKQALRSARFKADEMGRTAQYECEGVQAMLGSSDRAEGARAFAERRPPVWRGS